jgi:hypothetical protein
MGMFIWNRINTVAAVIWWLLYIYEPNVFPELTLAAAFTFMAIIEWRAR